ncbi:hypothetical protein [Clostridium saccharoperbutylacetonicum]|jgi:hypothetical protein|uniref:Uncharacterized protein n=1 Tax=Clostridium saccharoperbutylacetonicum N1-4(HMT) TaxID=931276 RepID=M1MQU3_9CLOT|nr:hypothetical protein [Clostridium saccharoperbutylacetonicum]AGF57121.1 hypothetical protein Cspa_c33600 [Clostridium saccharoperbutylacetonicum N1-4(HMT)]NRT62120.1 hypothetical protein [Clostridium saccharoperbutylacetonicum]NSB25450.1 hypothetical protein [Clostridium saccharoperbutylacetonicum]NSB44820.1 hypothetical protein [Clostridium saccharoperbutylacetonicum]
MGRDNTVKFGTVNEEKEVFAVLKASVVNGHEVESTLLGIYEDEKELKKDKKNLELDGHKTIVRVKVKMEPVEYMGDIENLK